MSDDSELEVWFHRIVETMAGPLLGYIQTIVRERNLSEDVLQNVMIRLIQAKRKGYNIQSLPAFLFTLARNEALREFGRAKDCLSLSDEERIFEIVSPTTVSPSESLELESALLQLSQPYREIIYLKIYANLTFAEIGKCLNIPTHTAASRYRYAIEKLRSLL